MAHSHSSTSTRVASLLAFPFRDSDARGRFLVSSGLALAGYLLPIVPWIYQWGYEIRLYRRTLHGEEPRMEPWGDWTCLADDGLRAGLIYLVYDAPGALLLALSLALPPAALMVLPFLSLLGGLRHGGDLLAWGFLGALAIWALAGLTGLLLLLASTIVQGPALATLSPAGAWALPFALASGGQSYGLTFVAMGGPIWYCSYCCWLTMGSCVS